MCRVCNQTEETVIHVLVKCPIAQLCLQKINFSFGDYMYFDEWVEEVLKHSRRNLINKVFMVAWAVWKNRNDIVWNQKGKEYEDIVISTLQVLNKWESAQDKTFDNTVGFLIQTDGAVCWEQPHVGQVKVNTDAALFTDSNCYSYAIVARDHSGTLLEAISCCKSGSLNPELAEAVGIREALSWVKSKDWSSAIIESDCLGAIQAIRCSSINLSYFGRVVDKCKKLLSDLEACNVTLKFVRRSANRVTHYIARKSNSIADRRWDMGEAHPNLIQCTVR